jgi:hypothetical protein
MKLARQVHICAALALGLAHAGCSAAFYEGLSNGLAAPSGSSMPAGRIMVFGGEGHDTYLGCLSCPEYAQDSLFNEYGPHGSTYSSNSIFNPYSQYGSRYAAYSACNPYASDPPVVVDQDGHYYGRLTVNRYSSDRFGDVDLDAWLEAVCQS